MSVFANELMLLFYRSVRIYQVIASQLSKLATISSVLYAAQSVERGQVCRAITLQQLLVFD